MSRIKASFGSLDGLVARIDRMSDDVESQLDGLRTAIAKLATEWTGGASEAFQEKIDEWNRAAADLHQSLRRLGRIVHTANGNYRSALSTNTRMWPSA
ncbi:MAG TPA: WXG100 family type VII secretion target [Pseudonocardiaceae bacterium]|nr:WXG100 family type VII secretion target [Pseudonocardiaceae bacterium]